MASNLKPVDYLDRDMESILQSMVTQISNITNRWTDRNASDIGIAILELLSFSLENLHFYMDRQANEAFLSTARERKNIINLCKLINYRLSGVTSSLTVLQFSIDAPLATRVDIPKWTQVSTSGDEPVLFATTEEAHIPAGDTSVLVGARQGVFKSENFKTTGQASQKFVISSQSADADSFEVVIDGAVWTQVSSFVDAQASDRYYIVDSDPDNGDTYIQLGDGYYGYSPPFSAVNNVTIEYLESSGADGNAGTSTITTTIDTIYDELLAPVAIDVINTQAATGGDDIETIEHAKIQAPAELAALYRAVTRGDFIALSNGFPGVGKTNCWGEQEVNPPDYNLFNWVMLAVAPENVTRSALLLDITSGYLSDELKEELKTYLYQRANITTRLKLLDPTYVPVDLYVDVYYEKNASSILVRRSVEDAIFDFFAFDNVEFGREIRLSNLLSILDSLEGVEYVEFFHLASPDSDPWPGGEAPSIGVVNTVVLKYDELPYLNNYIINVSKAVPLPTPPTVYPCPDPGEIPEP